MPHSGANSVTTWSPSRDERHAVADALDDAGALVAEHARHVAARIGPGRRVEVGVADAAGDEPHERLAGLRLGQLDVLDDERLPELLEHRGAYLHQKSPTVRPWSSMSTLKAAGVAESPGIVCMSPQSATSQPAPV